VDSERGQLLSQTSEIDRRMTEDRERMRMALMSPTQDAERRAVIEEALRQQQDAANAGTSPRLINGSSANRYFVRDPANVRFQAEAHLENGGELSLTMRTKLENGVRSEILQGEEQFAEIMKHFGDRVTGIRGAWSYGTNLDKFNELMRDGKSEQEAALGTWTGEQAVRAGFTNVTIRSLEGAAGNYTKVNCLFHK
jgi:hypothetical protein